MQWVPIRGTSATLTMPELRAANDLNNMVPSPLSELPVAKLPPTEIVKCVPAGTESDTDSSVMDSGDEWDKTETVGPSRSSTPTTKIGPTWADVQAATQEEEMVDSQSAVEDQFDDVIVEDKVVIQTMTEEEELDHAVAGELLTQRGEADKDELD